MRCTLLCLGLAGLLSAAEPAFTVAAAASLGPAMDAALAAHAAAGGAPGRGSYAASSTLAKQIEQGAPVHLFISADTAWMDWCGERGLIEAASRIELCGNELVLIAPSAASFTVELEAGTDLAAAFAGRWSTGDPSHVPAGRYAQQALTTLGMWEALQPRLIAAADVRAALRLVASGEAAAGVVYATDAAASDQVTVVARFPAGSHDPIVYPAAIVGVGNDAARAFLAFLRGEAGQAMLVKHGFLAAPTPAP